MSLSEVFVTDKMNIIDDLRRSGLKNTKHRTEILDILEQSSQPMTTEQIYLDLKNKGISVDLSTVYRTLETMSEKSLVVKLNIAGNSKVMYEYNRMVHKHYLVCLGCKKISSIDHCPLENYEKSLEKETNYSIAGHKLDIYGYCPECRKKGRQED